MTRELKVDRECWPVVEEALKNLVTRELKDDSPLCSSRCPPKENLVTRELKVVVGTSRIAFHVQWGNLVTRELKDKARLYRVGLEVLGFALLQGFFS